LTTSFESTTDNTDSLGEASNVTSIPAGASAAAAGHGKMQQIRADSGYRSFETSHAPRLSQKQDSIDLEEPAAVDAATPGAAAAATKTEEQMTEPVVGKRRLEFHGRHTPDSLYFESVNELETDSRSGGDSPSSFTTTTIMSKRNKAMLMPRYLR
jgi:hypothetical protein